MQHLSLNLLIVTSLLISACDGGGESSGANEAGAPSTGQPTGVAGQLSIASLPAEDSSDISLKNREVQIKDENDVVIAKAVTGKDGNYNIPIPASVAIEITESGNAAEATTAAPNNLALIQAQSRYRVEAVIADTQSKKVIGIRDPLSNAVQNNGVLEFGQQDLKKITALRGRVLLDSARDHTGIVVYVPGTDFDARTDSSGQFVMTFINPGTYTVRMEKDGYIAKELYEVVVTQDETTIIEPQVLRLSGGVTATSVTQVGVEGFSTQSLVSFIISPGSADRYKAGLANEIESAPYAAVPELWEREFSEDGTYDIIFIFADADGFESTFQRRVVVDTQKPDVSLLSLADRATANTNHTNDSSIMVYHPTCEDIAKVAILTSDATPSESDFFWDCNPGANEDASGYIYTDESKPLTYSLWAKDAAGNVSEVSKNGTITYDTTAPSSPGFSLADQTSFRSNGSDTTTVYVNFSTCSDVDKVIFSEYQTSQPRLSEFTLDCTTTANSFSYNFGNNINETKRVYAWAVDAAGNISATASYADIVLDQIAPTATSFTTADPTDSTAGYTNDTLVHISVNNCNDITHVLVAEGQTTPPSELDTRFQPCNASPITATVEGEGVRTLYLWARDIGGNVSVAASTDTITSDQTAPSATTLSLTLSDPTSTSTLHVNSQTIDAIINNCDNEHYKVYLSESSTRPSASAVTTICSPGSFTESFSFANTTNESKTVNLWVKDIAGNLSADSIQYSINLDTVDPNLPSSFSLSDPVTSLTNYSTTRTVDYTISGCDQASDMILIAEGQSTEPSESAGAWQTCQTTGSLTDLLSASQGAKNVYFWVKDIAGNIAGPTSHSITYDSIAPVQPTMDTYPSHTQSPTVTLSGSTEAGAIVLISDGSNDYQTTADGSGNFSQLVSLADNSANNFSVRARDAAENLSSPTNFTIYHDTIAPTISNVQILLTDTTATIYWDNNETTDRTLRWDLDNDPSYANSAGTAATGSTHSILIDSLTTQTTYYFIIQATDLAGNYDAGNNYTGSFTTYIGRSGSMASDETWNNTTVPYYISSVPYTIDSGVTLTISPGVTIKMPSAGHIRVEGKLVAQGTSGSKITFTSNQLTPTANYRDKIEYMNGSTPISLSGTDYVDGNLLDYVDIEYATTGVSLGANADVYIDNSSLSNMTYGITPSASTEVYVFNSSFSTLSSTGVRANGIGGSGTLQVDNVVFDGMAYGIYLRNGYQNGSNIDITNSTFRNFTTDAFYYSPPGSY